MANTDFSSPRPGKGPGAAAKPISVRLTDEERQALAERAGRTPLATYIRNSVLSGKSQAPRRLETRGTGGDEALARVLAFLGRSGIGENLSRLAGAAKIGALPVTPETEGEICDACIAVFAMRDDLMRALGLPPGGTDDP